METQSCSLGSVGQKDGFLRLPGEETVDSRCCGRGPAAQGQVAGESFALVPTPANGLADVVDAVSCLTLWSGCLQVAGEERLLQ